MDEERLHAAIAAIRDRMLAPAPLNEVGGIIEWALDSGSSVHVLSDRSDGAAAAGPGQFRCGGAAR